MNEAERLAAQGDLWRSFTGPEFLQALRDGDVSLAFHEKGLRISLTQSIKGPGTWDFGDESFRSRPG